MSLNWKIGVEIELMAPKGLTRRDLAIAIAKEQEGNVRSFFHPQSEPSKVPGTPLFQNLTLGFEIVNSQGELIAKCVDDLTLQDDLNKHHSPQPGWYRIVSDDARLLHLIIQQANPVSSLTQVMLPIAKLFGTEAEIGMGEMVRVVDKTGNAVAIAAPLPGERERPCELITAPIEFNHLERLESLLAIANEMEFSVPKEAATHLHFDAKALQSPLVLANLMRILWIHGDNLKQLMKTNPNCRRLGKWSKELYEIVQQPQFLSLSWEEAKTQLAEIEITKYCDFNIKNIIQQDSEKLTFEVRILPVSLQAQTIIEAAGLFEAILNWAITSAKSGTIKTVAPTMEILLHELPMSEQLRQVWLMKN